MRAMRVDFLAPPVRSSRYGAALLALGVLLAGAAVLDDSDRSDELVQIQAKVKKTAVAVKRAEAARAPHHGYELAGIVQSGDVLRRLASPWGELLDALEQTDGEGIALLAVDPDAERGRLRLAGEAKNLDALVGYIKSLDGRAGIADLRVLTQQVKEKDVQRPIEFVLESNWLVRPQSAAAAGAKS